MLVSIEIRLANGTRTSMVYNAAGWVSDVEHLKSNNSIIQTFDYTFDNVGNRGVAQVACNLGRVATRGYHGRGRADTEYPLKTNLLGFAPRLASNLGHPAAAACHRPTKKPHRARIWCALGAATVRFFAAGRRLFEKCRPACCRDSVFS